MDTNIRRITLLIFIIIIFYLLKILSSLLIPLIFAFIFAMLFQPIIRFLLSKKTPKWLILPVVSVLSLFILLLILNIIFQTSSDIATQSEYLSSRLVFKFDQTMIWINSTFSLSLDYEYIKNEITGLVSVDTISATFGPMFSSIGSLTGSFFMFALYYVIILSGMTGYEAYITFLTDGSEDNNLRNYLDSISQSVLDYLIIKTTISLCTALLVLVCCLIFGIKFALLWCFLTFLLNFIPSIGSILATLPPTLMAFIQFDSISIVLLLLLFLVLIQLLMGSVIEPKVMGNKLRLNTITVIFGLVFWGYIWGISGMILSIPLLVVIKLIFDTMPSLQFFGRLMSYPAMNKSN